MTDVPRRAPLTEGARVRTIATTVANGSQFGGTRMAKPITRRMPVSTPFVPTSSGGGIVGSATYQDPGTSTSATYQIDPSSNINIDGDDSSIAYASTGTGAPGVAMVDAGWYQAFVYVQITGGTVGTVPTVQLHWPDAGWDAYGLDVTDGVGATLTATTPVSRNFNAGGIVRAIVNNPGGGTINSALIQLTRFPGA